MIFTWVLFNFIICQSLPRVWEALGPFPHGTREVGYDPLSSFGGFESMEYSTNDQYPSELADGGYVSWRRIESNIDGSVQVQYDDIRWEFNLRSMGWTTLQHATFLRGKFDIEKSGVYLISFKGLITFKIDENVYPGDVYGFDHASESSVYLEKGSHMLYAHLVLDVRIHGGNTPPRNQFVGSIRSVDLNTNGGVLPYPKDTILPELMDGILISPIASVSVKNSFIPEYFDAQGKMTDGPGWKQVLRIQVRDENSIEIPAKIATVFTIMLAPGQTAAIPFRFMKQNVPKKIWVDVILLDLDTETLVGVPIGSFELVERTWGQVYKITMEGYDTAIQYAYVKPPRKDCLGFTNKKCPVIVALHGAGVKVSDQVWLDAIAQQDHAWVLTPSGRTPWGFDWHGPSYRNIDASVDALDHLWGVPLELADKLEADADRLIIMGHSNGGHGCWWYTSHYPDRVIAAVPAAGFLKIQMYVPYFLHVGFAHADPMMRGFLESSISENDLDLYASNMGGIPILARSGAMDTNVPPIHTRRMMRLIDEWSGHSKTIRLCLLTRYVEDPGQGHWYDGVLNDQIVQSFLDQYVDPKRNPELALPNLPNPFTISTLNPGSTGTRGGIHILQLIIPYRLASITVEQVGSHWKLTTSNVRRFGFARDPRQKDIKTWSVDDSEFLQAPLNAGPSYLKVGNYTWELAEDLLWISRERSPTTYGPISQVFSHPLRIVIPSSPTANLKLYREMARHITTQWYTYSRGTTQIIRDVDVLDGYMARYNLIVLGDPRDNYYTMRRSQGGAAKLITFLNNGTMQIGERTYDKPGTGALFLAPSPARTRLCLFVTGLDQEGLKRAVWTIPFRTGLEVADYTIVGTSYGDPATGWSAAKGMRTKGAGGILATGYWSNDWDYEKFSGYLK